MKAISATKKKVAVLVESTRSYARDLILGIARYQSEHQNWEIEFTPRGRGEPLPEWLKSWNGNGILARIEDRRMLRLLLAKGIPVVDLRRFITHPSIPQIGPNDRKVVQMVFEHFRMRRAKRFAFVGPVAQEHPALDRRFSCFRDLVRSEGSELIEIRLSEQLENTKQVAALLRRRIKSMTFGTAILAATDDWGLTVLESCRFLERSVPNDLLVAGVGNDHCLCELSLPKLTSVDLNAKHIGYLAAEMLQKMMKRSFAPPQETFVDPRFVIARSSTDMISVDDPYVQRAVQFIRSNADKKIVVGDVVKYAHLCRVALENHFKKVLGHSIFQEIMSVKIEAIKERLAQTDLPIKSIAFETGFVDPMYMKRVFQKLTGETVKEYRRKFL